MGLPLLTVENVNKIWTTMPWAVCDGDVPVMLALRSIMVSALQCPELEAQGRVPQKRGTMGHTDGSMGG